MKLKSIFCIGVAAASFAYGQKIVPGKAGMYPELVRFENSNRPDFSGKPTLYDDSSKALNQENGRLVLQETDQLGYTTFKFQQTVNGIPVEYGIQNMQVKNNKVEGFTGRWVKNPLAAEKSASISEQIALDYALAYVGAVSYKWQDSEEENHLKTDSNDPKATYFPKGELVYFSNPEGDKPNKLDLAYKFDIYAQEPVGRTYVFVDAKSGAILGVDNIIHHANTPGTAVTQYSGNQPIVADSFNGAFRLREAGRNGGTSVETYNLKKGTSYSRATDFTDTDNNWNNVNTSLDQYATDAHWGAEMTVDYLKQKFNRSSIDNNHFPIKSYVHYSRNYFNAFWDGQRMTYGDGSSSNGYKPLTALDVCAHEIGHGMTSKTANLAYNKESGALNEGFSDILGNSVEIWARPNKNSWKLGEDFNYVIRDMSNPNAYRQPDTYGGTYWVNHVGCTPSSTNDYCGVHTNSGVLNFWYYLLVNGGSGTNDKGFVYSVSGIGLDKAAQIAYRTLTTYLTSSSNYMNARTYSLQAATDLYGVTSNEAAQVANAWDAVGVGGGTSAGKVASPTYTVSSVTNNSFIISFESSNASPRQVEVVSATGMKVTSVNAKVSNGSNRIEVQLPANTLPGVYYVVVSGERAGSVLKK